MTFIDDEFDRISAATDRFNAPGVTTSPIAQWAISQLARGTFEVRRRAVEQAEAWGQESLVTEYTFAIEFFANTDCESVLNAELGGPMTGQMVVVNADGEPSERGIHTGRFTWGRNGEIHGVLSGVSNAGTHRRPLYDAVTFDQLGQFSGRLDGTFDHASLGRCVLTASYVFDLSDPADDVTSDIQGVIEGVVITDGAENSGDGIASNA